MGETETWGEVGKCSFAKLIFQTEHRPIQRNLHLHPQHQTIIFLPSSSSYPLLSSLIDWIMINGNEARQWGVVGGGEGLSKPWLPYVFLVYLYLYV